jgi:transposase
MRNIREILRLSYENGLSSRKIALTCNCSYVTVLHILEKAADTGLPWPLPEDMDDQELEEKMYPGTGVQTESQRPLPKMEYLHTELSRPGVTLQLLWQEYKREHPDGLMYSHFCEHYRQWAKTCDLSMRQIHKAGEKMFVDWAGATMRVVGKETGEVQEAYLFVGVLGASGYTFIEGCLTMDMPNWIGAHCRAFRYFGGVPQVIVPDNLRTGVNKVCRYEPEINATYQEMANHYHVAVIPARPRKPKDKPKAEGSVLIAERWIVAALRNQIFFSITELNTAIQEKMEELNNKPFQKLSGSRRILFETVDKPALKPLPLEPYVFAFWKKVKVNLDYHVAFEDNYYSIPYQLVGEYVDLRISATTIEILHNNKRVASHLRNYGKRQQITIPEHRPANHRFYAEWSPERLVKWAQEIGPHTALFIQAMIDGRNHPEQAFHACLGILRLGKCYPAERMEKAALRALSFQAVSYKSFKTILEKGLDQLRPNETASTPIVSHNNIRGAAYYSSSAEVPPC